jgi:hypothetical protein
VNGPSAQDWPYVFEVIAVDDLFVDESYQRPLTTFAARIEKKFDPALVGTLVVSRRADGRHAVVDGQTRAEAIRRLGGTIAAGVPCLVYYGLSRADEARLFARLQLERRGIASAHRFRAAVVAGDPEACAIERIANRVGYDIGAGSNGCISAVAALEKAYRRSPETLERVLSILRRAWGAAVMPNGEVIRGLAYYLARNTVDDERMAARLATVTPGELKRRASALREGMGHGGGSDKYMAGAIEGIYRTKIKEEDVDLSYVERRLRAALHQEPLSVAEAAEKIDAPEGAVAIVMARLMSVGAADQMADGRWCETEQLDEAA